MAWCLSTGACAANAPDSKQISQELEHAKAAKPAQPETVEALEAATIFVKSRARCLRA